MEVNKLNMRTLPFRESRKRAENLLHSNEAHDNDENEFESPCDSIRSVNETSSKMKQCQTGLDSRKLFQNAVVVLTRLPEYKISSLRPPTPPQFYSEAESLSSSDSDMQWEPEVDSSDSDFSDSNSKRKTAKMTKYNGSDKTRPPALPPSNNNNAAEVGPIIVSSAFGHSSQETTNVRPNLPEVELKVDMTVIARKRPMRWQWGKIVEIVTKEDGRLKYKVSFEERGKSLLSGHHVAFDATAKLEQLYVGARVVVQCQDNKFRFKPGIVAELPSRKNHLRFLVFLDDHTPHYVGLPLLHLVCKQLDNVVDDIQDSSHKQFMKQYLKNWPYPQLTQYRPGQSLNAELDGVQQRCEVLVIDCSLMRVIFQENQQKEWIHRGSMRLEHMARFLELKKVKSEESENDSDLE